VQDEELETATTTTIPVTTKASSSEPVDGKIDVKTKIEHNHDDKEIDTTPASLEQCLRFLEIKAKRPNTVAVHVIRLNAVDLNRPKDTVLVDSGAECNVGNDIRKFISRISDTNTEVTFTDGSDSMRVEGIGTVREWYYDWRGHVFVDEYEAFYCPTAKYPIRSEQELRLKGWRVIRNPTRHGVDVKRKGPDGQEQILPVPRLIDNPRNPEGPQIHDPKTADLTHLVNPSGNVLVCKRYDVGTLEWLEPIQADGGTRKQKFNRANIPNSHASVVKNDVPYHEVLASHVSVCESIERRAKALRSANVIGHLDPAVKGKSRVPVPRDVHPGEHKFSEDAADLQNTTKDLQACMTAYLKARAARYGFRTEDVTAAMLNMESSFEALRDFDNSNAQQTYDARKDDCLNHDSQLKCVPVCPRCRQNTHTLADCREACWSCMLQHGHADDCEVASVLTETIMIPATESVVVRTEQHQSEIDHEQRLNAMFTAVSVAGASPGATNWKRTIASSTSSDVPQPADTKVVSVMLSSNEVLHAASILKLNDEEDSPNMHMLDDSDRLDLEAFIKQYSHHGTPSYRDTIVSSTEAIAAGQAAVAGPSGGDTANAAHSGSTTVASARTSSAKSAQAHKKSHSTLASDSLNPQCVMAHCSECHSVCVQLETPFTFWCDTCEHVFDRPYLARSDPGSDVNRIANVRKRSKETRMITAADIVVKRKNLIRNLTPHVLSSKELGLSSLEGMPCEEWYAYLNSNEQLALVVRGKMYTLAKKASEITLKDLRSSKEKPQWLKQRYDSSLRALERAKREWEQTLESVIEGLRMVFDPGASQGTFKRAAKVRATTSSTPNKTQA
jgi:hypothetical protein